MTQPLPILVIGDPRLRQISQPCDHSDAALRTRLAEMHSTLNTFRDRNGWGRALAAPQVGLPLRAIVVRLDGVSITVINPQITWESREKQVVWDDCFSLPDVSAPVLRHASISIQYTNEYGKALELKHMGPNLTELIEHEIDHLNGITFVERIIATKYIVARPLKYAAARHYSAELGSQPTI